MEKKILRTEEISHRGKVLSVSPGRVQVEIISESACSSCHAAMLCGMSESKKKSVEVRTDGYFIPGQEVTVYMKESLGQKAVLTAYVGPLAIFVAVLMTSLAMGAHELVASAAGIGAGALYYTAVWLLRDRLAKEYRFEIK